MIEVASHIADKALRQITEKIYNDIRISPDDGHVLFQKAELSLLAVLSSVVRRRKNSNLAYFNRNFHIEPTNKCIYNCRFCSYHKPAGDPDSWEYSHEEMLDIVKRFDNKEVTEVHIVGGVHPRRDLHYYGNMIKKIKEIIPAIHVKAFTAIELDFMI